MAACIEIMSNLNYLAVLVCTAVTMALGAFWYSPIAFVNPWMAGIGLKPEDITKQAATRSLIVSACTSLIEVFILASIIGLTGVKGFWMGLHIGGMIGIGCIAASMLSNNMYEQKPLKIWFINAGYRVVYFLINGGILAAWS